MPSLAPANSVTLERRVLETLIDAGISLSRTVALDRVFQETAFQVRRAIPGEGIAIGLTKGDSAPPRLAFAREFDADADVEERLRARWLVASDSERAIIHGIADGAIELDVPMRSGAELVGILTVHAEPLIGTERVEEAVQVLTIIAAQTAAAVERVALIRRIEQKRRLEAIAEVSAGVAHELRNPLFGISSAVQLVRFRAKDDPVVEKNVGRILREVERLNRMVTSLLEFTRPSPTVLVAGDPDAIWDDVLEEERARMDSRSLHLTRKRAKRHARVALDTDQLAQLFFNLLDNAIDASPDGATISLVTELLADGAWRCRLRNSSPDLSPEQLSRVFEMFYSTKAGHMGIGLTLCQRIIEEHGGTITLDSTSDTGTTLTIALPPHS